MTSVDETSGHPHPTDPALAGRVIAGCQLQTLLGSGGMGAVWRAHHLALDIPVAVKLLLPLKELEATAAERLLREARSAARLRHPNIVGVLNVGEEAGLPFLVMELVEGESLQQRLDGKGKLPLAAAVDVVKQVLSALELTFEHRIVHRDIKPDNLLFDHQGKIKLVDLGLAKQVGGNLNLTQTGAVMGSPYYIAPEQASNSKAVDGRADIYALGCTFFHLLAGSPPYGGSTYLEIILKHIQGPVADLSALAPEIPTAIVEIAARMMAKDPLRRYQTPTEVLADLAMWEAGQPIPIAREGQTPAPTRKRRTLLASGAGLAALLGWLGWSALQKNMAAPTVQPVPVDETTPRLDGAEMVRADTPAHPRRPEEVNSAPAPAPSAITNPARKVHRPTAREPLRKRGSNRVMDALVNRDVAGLRALLDRGASPNTSVGGLSPLHYAVLTGDGSVVRMLLEKGANPNAQDAAGETPLVHAMTRGYRELGAALLDFGANPNVRDRNGRTPLQLAGGDPYWTRKLLEKGAH